MEKDPSLRPLGSARGDKTAQDDMSRLTIESEVRFIPGVGPRLAAKFRKLKIETVADLLRYVPRRYEDLSNVSKIPELELGQLGVIKGTVWEKHRRRTRTGKTIVEAIIGDDSGTVHAVWFNQPYLMDTLKEDTEYLFSGKVGTWNERPSLESPTFEPAPKAGGQGPKHIGKIIAVYPETEGLTSRMIRNAVEKVLPLIDQVPPPEIGEFEDREELLDWHEAVREAHTPTSLESQKKALATIAFAEMLVWELKALRLKQSYQKESAYPVPYDVPYIRELVAKLPYQLTLAQKRSLHEILKDLERSFPMNRLLEGDVGSGKTAVAILAALAAVRSGGQAALMVPTEILARQHYQKNQEFIRSLGFEPLLIVGKEANFRDEKIPKKKAHELISEGKTRVIIGTHALIAEKVNFRQLKLAIVDEQHRFGVEQRAKLRQLQGLTSYNKVRPSPHLLTMTATPIPRTLALTLFGDLDLSIIDEMPPGRAEIQTVLAWSAADRERSYDLIRKEINSGRQAFVVVPLIDPSTKLGAGESEVRAVTLEHEKLDKEIFPELKVGLLHGKLKSSEKEEVMRDFAEGKTQVLVSTPVIEVGIDVPNATIMLIENAERFGLAQLHQFRGRVGRSKYHSYCVVIPGQFSPEIKNRLLTFAKMREGFKLAEEDLLLRGPGEVFGLKQSGMPDFHAASLTDTQLIYRARQAAEELLTQDPNLSRHPNIKNEVEETPAISLD